jgi:hypothetical protein
MITDTTVSQNADQDYQIVVCPQDTYNNNVTTTASEIHMIFDWPMTNATTAYTVDYQSSTGYVIYTLKTRLAG